MRAAQRTSSSSFGLGQVASGRLDDVPLPADPSPTLSAYAHPERLVTADWLSAHMGAPGLAIVESDEDVLLYDVGHIPGAVKIDWHTDLNDPRVRDYINGEQFAELMDRKGIARDDTVVIYGDKSNWWAAYALWVFTLFGHADVRLLNGGRDLWLAERRETTLDVPTKTCTGYPVVQRNDAPIRAFRDDVLAILGAQPLIDVRSPEEYTGKRTHMPDYPEEGALRAGHIPTAVHIPWGKAADESGRFRSREELERLYDFINPDDQTVVYCRIGERSSHTWFVLTHLLGKADVRNYDGARGPSGATPCECRSSRAKNQEWYPSYDRAREPARAASRGGIRLRRSPGSRQAEAVAGIRQRAAGASVAPGRVRYGAGPRVPVSAVFARRRE
ncbi:thiosulfate sulfurtransferase [Mycobacterium tuberculosis]|nr:thiosulfate sulfurtransferase [Mycobacterium tuberculosis]